MLSGIGDFFSRIPDYIVGFFSQIRFPNDLIDVLIVAYIIYLVIQLVRDTRAVQLLKGILLFAAIYLAAVVFRLHTLSFILEMVVTYGVIVVVVFQPEFRRALEKMGQSKISKIISRDTADEETKQKRESISQIVKAVKSMSKGRTGALMVFEQQTKLGDIINTGTVINADIQKDLIENIFFNKAPLHDGAMIIRDFRLYAAGCFLPLSQNESISRELGTRHRAAVGISENSDALTVVVSEETGIVSITHNGILSRNISDTELAARLEESLIGDVTPAKGFFRWPSWRKK